MHPKVFQEFEKICSTLHVRGALLEVGATPDGSSLLNMKSLKDAREKVGINLAGPSAYNDFSILKGNANSMTCFNDSRFDLVLCNATLEHDKYFWKTISEIKRVTRSGGWIVIGAPGYGVTTMEKYIHAFLKRIPFMKSGSLAHSTKTLGIHNYPGDYYRFSPQAFAAVFFEGMRDVTVRLVMSPPRIIGWGSKP